MKKSIMEKMISRILSHPCQAMNGLVKLSCMKRQEEKYTIKNLKDSFPFLKEDDLEFKRLSDILENLEKQIIRKINFLSQHKDNKNLYELTVLVGALYAMLEEDHEPEGLIKNDRVQLCYYLDSLITDCCSEKNIEFWYENLKKLSFN